MTTQFGHVYIERNTSYRIPCSVFPASKSIYEIKNKVSTLSSDTLILEPLGPTAIIEALHILSATDQVSTNNYLHRDLPLF